jgi:hypothetical protein
MSELANYNFIFFPLRQHAPRILCLAALVT